MRAVCKVRGLTLLLRVGTSWRCGDGSLFRSTSLGKGYTSYNSTSTSGKRVADRWSLRNFLPWSSLFMVEKAQKSHGARYELYGGCSNGVSPIHFFQPEQRIQFRDRHSMSTNFRLRVTRWVHELCKRPSYLIFWDISNAFEYLISIHKLKKQ
jgi:hypothetical protein